MNFSEMYSSALVPARHKKFRVKEDNNSPEWLRNYELLKERIDARGSIALLGDRGTGKTQAAVSSIGYCCSKLGKMALYTKAFDVFLSIRNGNNINSSTTELQEVNKYIKPHLLVIDAFEVRGDTDFENRTLDHILDKRYDANKPTIIISNDSQENFLKAVGISIIDRFREKGGIIAFQGKSFRGSK